MNLKLLKTEVMQEVLPVCLEGQRDPPVTESMGQWSSAVVAQALRAFRATPSGAGRWIEVGEVSRAGCL